jgi:DNA-binding NarL/FixJ family response regulator
MDNEYKMRNDARRSDVLARKARGETLAQIAAALGITTAGVRYHLPASSRRVRRAGNREARICAVRPSFEVDVGEWLCSKRRQMAESMGGRK